MKSLALLLLGAWLAGTIIMAVVATQNFRTVDRLLAAPSPQAVTTLASVPPTSLRPVLRYLSSELNRLFFFSWGVAQIVIGLGLMAVLMMSGRRSDMLFAAAMLAVATVELFAMTPSITSIGRLLDFVPRNPLPADAAPLMAKFWRLHGAYTGSEGVKLILGAVLAWRLSK